MLRVALTGGIGSGKTTVTNHLQGLNVPVLDADEISRALTGPGGPAVAPIIKRFGASIATHRGELDRPALRSRVFDNPKTRKDLEKLLHPMIRAEMASQEKVVDYPYCVFSIPLLLETNRAGEFDAVVVVDAPDAIRRRWIQSRSGLDANQIDAIFKVQASREERLAVATHVLHNEGSIQDLLVRINDLHVCLLTLAKSKTRGAAT
jgi:dephospho-CoA kinase